MKKKFIWLIFSFLLAGGLLLASCGPSAEEAAPITPSAEEAAPAELPTFALGETGSGAGVDVTITEPTIVDSYQYQSTSSGKTITKKASSSKTFLITTVHIVNTSITTRLSGTSWMRVHDSGGNSYAALSYFGEDALPLDHYMPEGTELNGKALFQIPQGVTGLKIRYTQVGWWELE